MPRSLPTLKSGSMAQTLRRCPLFAGPPKVNLAAIAAITVRKRLAKGDYLFYEGSAVHGFYIVEQGAIKLHRVNLTGKEQIIHVFRPQESFAEETLVSDLGYPANACATEDSQVLMVQKSSFVPLIKRQPELALCMLRSMNRHFCTLVDLLEDLRLKDVKTRLANWLLEHCPEPESREPYQIQLPMSKRMLASELGTISETFSRTLAKFRNEKLLSVEGKTVTLLCPSKLAQFVRQQARPNL